MCEEVREYDHTLKRNKLHWTMELALKGTAHSKEYSTLYKVCDYYRHVRNAIVHTGMGKEGLNEAFGTISGIHVERINAPNKIERICFDDQVLFARSARSLLEAIYHQCQYDWQEVQAYHIDSISRITKKCKNDPHKANQKTLNYLRRLYPIPEEGITINEFE